jgi:type VI secretion system protein ImpJ
VQRFSRISTTVDDFNAGGSQQPLEFAVPNLRLLFGTERHERMATLPIAQLARQTDGKIVLRDAFVPPVLQIGAAPFLTSGLRRVLGAISARQRELAAARKQRTASTVEFHYTDARRFWLLHTLNSSIPVLSHLLDAESAHPEEVYLALAGLMGALCTFAADADPASIPKFNFAQLGNVFEVLFARVLALVSVDSAPVFTEIPLERRPDGMFVGKFPEPRLGNHEFFVAVRSALPEPVVRERVPQLMKVAGWRHIAEVVKQARHGVRAEIEWTPSSSLPVKPGLCFFRLKREGNFWEEVASSGTIALYMPNDADWKEVWLSVYAIDPTYLQ